MATLGNLIVNITSNTKGLEDGLTKSRGLIGGAGGALGGLGKVAGTVATGGLMLAGTAIVGTGVAAAGAGVMVTKMAFEFEEACDAIIAGTGASGESLEEMKGIVKSLSTGTAGLDREFDEMAEVVAELNARTGASGPILEDMSANILKMSRLTGEDAVESVGLVTRVMGDWGVATEDSAGLIDMLYGAHQSFGIGVDDLSRKIVQFGAPMRQMGFSIEESIALFGKWEQEGVNAELAIGSLRIASGYFARNNIDLQEGLQTTMERIKGAATESEGLAIAMEVFGARAGPDMAAAIREGRFELETAVAAVQNTSGALEAGVQGLMGFDDRWAMLKKSVMVALMPIGEKVLELAETIMPKLTPVFEMIITVIEEKFTPAVTGLIDRIPQIMEKGSAVWSWITGTAIPKVVEWANVFKNEIMPRIRDFAENVLSNMLSTGQEVWAWIVGTAIPTLKAWAEEFRTGIRPQLEAAWARLREFITDIKPSLQAAWVALQELWETIVDVFDRQLKPALDDLAETLGLNTGESGDFLESLGEVIGFILRMDVEGLIILIKVAVEGFTLAMTLAKPVVEGLATAFGLFIGGIQGIIDIGQSVIDTIHDMGDALGSVGDAVPDWLVPGSPTAFEMGLRGIAQAMDDVKRVGGATFNLQSAGAGGAGNTVSMGPITIQVTAPAGTDGYSLGQQIGAGLVSRARAAGLR